MTENWLDCPNVGCTSKVSPSQMERFGECAACWFEKRPPLHPDVARSNQRVRERIGRKR